MKTAAVATAYPADIAKSTRIETLLASGGGSAARNTASVASSGGARTGGSTASGGASAPAAAPAQQAAPAEKATPAPAPATPAPTGPKTYKVCDKGPAGGIVFYDMGFSMNGWRYLEAAPADIPGVWQWSNNRNSVDGTNAGIWNGKHNTQIIVEFLNQERETMKAAQVADAYEYGGFSDWYLPSKDELNLMYTNLKANDLGGFQRGWYWTSLLKDWSYVFAQNFSNGESGDRSPSNSYYVRPIRQF